MIIQYLVHISLWPMLGIENRYIYTRHSSNNDRTVYTQPLYKQLRYKLELQKSIFIKSVSTVRNKADLDSSIKTRI